MEDSEQLLTVGEAAEVLGKKPPTLYEAIQTGHLPSRRVLGRIALLPADVIAYGERTAGVGTKGGRPKNAPKKRGRPRKENVAEL